MAAKAKVLQYRVREYDVQCALEAVVDECKPERGFEGYGMAYAARALHMVFSEPHFIEQLMYVISNLQTWRGPRAREAKKVIRAWIAQNPKA